MKIQALSETPKVSSAKLGIYCTIFCLVSGLIFGTLKSSNYPVTPFGMGLVSFAWALFWCGLGLAALKLRTGNRIVPLLILGIYTVNIAVSIYVLNCCQITSTNYGPSYIGLGDFGFPPKEMLPKMAE